MGYELETSELLPHSSFCTTSMNTCFDATKYSFLGEKRLKHKFFILTSNKF